MAVAFTENEKAIIKLKLQKAAEECLGTYGIRKTTVEQLAKMSGISKGAFYIFYESKEILFFEVLEVFQKNIFEQLILSLGKLNLSKEAVLRREIFTSAIFELYQRVKDSFIPSIMQNNDIEILFTKLPPELITEHHSFDDILAANLFEAMQIDNNEKLQVVSAALRAIFMTMLHEKEVGIHYLEAMKMLISGIANQIIEEN